MADEFSEHFIKPDILPPPDGGTQKYLADLFRQLGYAAEDDELSTTLSTTQTPSATSASSTAAEPVQTCGGTTYAEAIPNAVGFVKGLTSAFCNDRGQNNNAKDAFRKEYSASDAKKVQFEWKPGNLTSADCTSNDACSKTLGDTLTRCQGYDLNSAYKSGNYSNECGTYSYSISGYPEPSQSSSSAATSATTIGKQTTTSAPKPSSSSDPTACGILLDPWYEDGPVAYARNIFQTAKHSYCFNGVEHVAHYDRYDGSQATYYIDRNKMDPFIHLTALCQGEPTDNAWVQLSKSLCDKAWNKKTRATVRVQVSRSPDQTGCESLKHYKVPQGRECDAIFDRLIDKCMPMGSEMKSEVTKKPPTPPKTSTNMQFNTILIAFLSLAASAAACTGDTHECCIGYSQDNQTIYDECCGNPADFAC
ncbi:hypothetical protein GTA08_BOTSDO09040 [Botryosphaeria dothidea]|uniref:Uncharacterized protein n=1 Tax=Botryosphaeria dothidea TaxID=55169 RepID=A0A8H4IL61_9PEZI|nr:hypothetical protein GTA08_BOTSDO09040 [Botryosphaeria dothidea]